MQRRTGDLRGQAVEDLVANSSTRAMSIFLALSAGCASVRSDVDEQPWTEALSLTPEVAPHWTPLLVPADLDPLVPSSAQRVLAIPLPFVDVPAAQDADVVLLHPRARAASAAPQRRSSLSNGVAPSERYRDPAIYPPGMFVDVTRLADERAYWEELSRGVTLELYSTDPSLDSDAWARRSRVNASFGPAWTVDGMVLGLSISF
ncbi:MAG: hypothetical protein ACKVWV_11150 [Planctomycetota bacterium]